MADLGNRTNVNSAIDLLLDDLQPNLAIQPSDHNALLKDILDTLANGLSVTLRTGNTTSGQNIEITSGDSIQFENSTFLGSIVSGTLTAGRTYTLPDKDGTLAMTSDIATIDLNSLTDVTTGLPITPTEADDGKVLFYDFDTNQWITDDAVTHGTSVINCKKSTAGTIAKGLPVYLVGFDADLHTVELANASNTSTMPVIGFTAEALDNTNSKHVTTFGKLTGIDTTSTVSTLNPNGETWAINEDLYISTTAGGLTKVRPTGGTTQIQRIAKVLKVDATGGQLFVFNTARTSGLPNLGIDKLWIGDANGIPQEVDKSTIGGASIYTQDGTIGSGRVATLTDSLTFKGADNLSTSSNIKVQGFAGTDLWDFRNNGDVYLNQSSSVYMATNKTLKVDGSSNTNQNLFELNGSTNAFGTGAITVGAYGNVEVKGVNSAGNFKVLTMLGNEYFTLDGNGNNSILRTKAFDIGTSTTTGYKMSFDAGRHQFIRLGIVGAYFDLVNNSVQFWEAGMTSRKFIIGNSSLVGTEEISFQGRTAVKGANTLSTATAFEIYDGDTTPSKLWDFRNDGNLIGSGKRITNTIVNPTVQQTTSTATLTIDANTENTGVLTAQAVNLTVASPTGSPVQGQKLVFRFTDNGTSRTITWNAIFRAIGVTLPTATTSSKTLYVGCIYNLTATKWDVVAVNEEA